MASVVEMTLRAVVQSRTVVLKTLATEESTLLEMTLGTVVNVDISNHDIVNKWSRFCLVVVFVAVAGCSQQGHSSPALCYGS